MKLTKTHWKTEMKYLNAIADVLIKYGYEVTEPSTKHRDILDVWGKFKNKKCFLEICVSNIQKSHGGILGVWSVPEIDENQENDLHEIYLDNDGYTYSSDTSYLIADIAEQINPIKKEKEVGFSKES